MFLQGGNAVISLIFSEYLNRIFWHSTRPDASPDDMPQWAIKLVAIAAVFLVTFLTIATRNLGTRTAIVFTTVKVRIQYSHVSVRIFSRDDLDCSSSK
jgi:amino acid transporter